MYNSILYIYYYNNNRDEVTIPSGFKTHGDITRKVKIYSECDYLYVYLYGYFVIYEIIIVILLFIILFFTVIIIIEMNVTKAVSRLTGTSLER